MSNFDFKTGKNRKIALKISEPKNSIKNKKIAKHAKIFFFILVFE